MADTLLHPDVRRNAIFYLRSLSDLQYQEECWVHQRCPPGIKEDSFGMAVHFLFDDADFFSGPEKQIGYSLNDNEEAAKLNFLCREIDKILEIYGTERSDHFYIHTPEWPSVINAARRALDLIRKNEVDTL